MPESQQQTHLMSRVRKLLALARHNSNAVRPDWRWPGRRN